MSPLKIVFMGTPVFALPSLDAIDSSSHHLEAVVTRPDSAKGRGRRLQLAPAAEWARSKGLEVARPTRMQDRSFQAWLKEKAPDLIVTVAYGRILPPEILSLPPLGCINLHASYLPYYRGAAPIHRAVIEGARYSGVSIIKLTSELDAGDIIVQEKEPLALSDTAGTLHDRLSEKGSRLLIKAIDALADGTAELFPQDHEQATYAPPLRSDEERLDWSKSPLELYNHIRGFNPWPGAYTTFKGKRLKVWRAAWPQDDTIKNEGKEPGTILKADENSLTIATGQNGVLTLTELQPAGKSVMDAGSFCCGYRIEPGLALDGEY